MTLTLGVASVLHSHRNSCIHMFQEPIYSPLRQNKGICSNDQIKCLDLPSKQWGCSSVSQKSTFKPFISCNNIYLTEKAGCPLFCKFDGSMIGSCHQTSAAQIILFGMPQKLIRHTRGWW